MVKAPFRVAGALTNGVYQGGKKVVDASSEAMEKRKLKKEKETVAVKKEEAAPTEGPAIPLPDAVGPTTLPVE